MTKKQEHCNWKHNQCTKYKKSLQKSVSISLTAFLEEKLDETSANGRLAFVKHNKDNRTSHRLPMTSRKPSTTFLNTSANQKVLIYCPSKYVNLDYKKAPLNLQKTTSESFINKLSIEVWFVRIGYLAEIHLFENLKCVEQEAHIYLKLFCIALILLVFKV